MRTIVKSPRYEADMVAIWDQIAQHNPQAVERVVMATEDTIELLAEFPRLGTPCPHLVPGLRRMQWRSYLYGRRQITPESFA